MDCPSPNHGPRRPGATIDILLLHYTGMESAEAARRRLCDPAAKVSAHYLIEEGGRIWRLVPEERRAWHAGLSFWAGERDVNSRSIGIELANPGHEWGYRDFPQAQMAALEGLARDILARHPIPLWRVLGHSDVAPQRKRDPGERFDWAGLARAGIGLWPEWEALPGLPSDLPSLPAIRADLARFGYDIRPSGQEDAEVKAVVAAFQRHFRPARVDGVIDHETAWRLGALLRAMRA